MEKAAFGAAEEVFSRDKKTEEGPSVKELHAKIGQLAMENDFLSVALGRIGEPSAKKMIDPEHVLPLTRQSRMLELSRLKPVLRGGSDKRA